MLAVPSALRLELKEQMESSLKDLIEECKQKKVSNEVFVMQINADNMERCNMAVLEKYWRNIMEFMLKRELDIPTACMTKWALLQIDDNNLRGLSKFRKRGSSG